MGEYGMTEREDISYPSAADGMVDATAKLAEIESGKYELKSYAKEYKSAVKRVVGVGRTYDKAALRSSQKPGGRSNIRLQRAEGELDAAVQEMKAVESRFRDAVQAIYDKYDDIYEFYMMSGKRWRAKKYRRMGERFMNAELEKIDGLGAPAAMYSSIRGKDRKEPLGAPHDPYTSVGDPRYERAPYNDRRAQGYPQQPFYFVPTYVDPSAYGKPAQKAEDVKEEVKAAVAEAMAPYIQAIDEKLASIAIVPAAQAQAGEGAPDAETVECARRLAEELRAIIASFEELVGGAEKISEKCKEISAAQSEVIEQQRTFAREMQGIQVKQKLVNSEQCELAEAQEVTLQQQKLLNEKHTELAEEQKAVLEGIEAVTEAHRAASAAIKESIQTQKGIIQANSRNNELQRELAQKQAALAEEQKELVHSQKLLARAVKGARKNTKDEENQ